MPLRRSILRIGSSGPDVRHNTPVLYRAWHRAVQLTTDCYPAFQGYDQFMGLAAHRRDRSSLTEAGATI